MNGKDIYKCIVSTNCEDDPHQRVKVKNPNFWEDESELMPALNGVYLEKGDAVLVWMPEIRNAVILGKYPNFEQEQNNPLKSEPVLFKGHKGGTWIEGTVRHKEVLIKSNKNFEARGFWKDLKVITPNKTEIYIKDNRILLKNTLGQVIELREDTLITVKNNASSLFSLWNQLLTALITTVPTTVGTPVSQNFNPKLLAQLAKIQAEMVMLLSPT